MARIYRSHDPGATSAHLGRHLLEEFPEAPEEESGEEFIEEEEVIDPVALREAVLAEAREEAARKVEEAYQEGLRRGTEAGERAFAAEVATAAQALESAAQAMTEAREVFLSRLEGEVVALTRGIIERILLRESGTDQELVTRLARRALEALLDEEDVRLRVNPADRTALQSQRVFLLEQFHGLKRLVIEADELIEPGGCVADTRNFHADFQPLALLDHLFEDVFGEGRENV